MHKVNQDAPQVGPAGNLWGEKLDCKTMDLV